MTTTAESETTALAVAQSQPIAPMPVFSGAQMAGALTAYKDLQRALDESMPDQIMNLEGKPFRKKGYWRAIATAFNISTEPIEERREVSSAFDDGRDNFGYVVTYRATAPNGRSITGDGSCFAVEKARRFKCPHPHPTREGKTEHWPHDSCPSFDPAFQWRSLPAQATEHNIRSHAHTRAFNRAISNLVGFGEVSAEEVDRESSDTFDAEIVARERGASAKPEVSFGDATATPPAEPGAVEGEVVAQADLKPGERAFTVTRVAEVKKGSNARGPWTLYGIETKELGKDRFVTTFDKSEAKVAFDAKNAGRQVAMVIDEERKGNFTNYSVKAIRSVAA